MQQHEPMFNVPGAVTGVLALLVAVHLGLAALPVADERWWVLALSFNPARHAGFAAQIPGGPTATFTSFFTHMLVHGDLTHLAFNCVWLLAFGGAMAQRLGGARFIVFTVFCGVAGAVAFLALNLGLYAPVIGASGAISGLMGGVFRFLFNAGGSVGLRRLQSGSAGLATMPLATALTDRRVLTGIAIWLGVNFLALLGIGGPEASGGIAWEAHIGGFAAGFLMLGAFEDQDPAPHRIDRQQS